MEYELNSLTGNPEKAKSSIGSTDHQENCSTASSYQQSRIKRCCSKSLTSFQTILSCFLLLAVVSLMVAVILHSTKLNGRIHVLEAQIEAILARNSTSAVAESAALQTRQMSQLHEQVEAIGASLNASLHSLSVQRQQLSAIMAATNVSELQDHLQDLEASLTSVNESLRQRFSGCYEDRRSCTVLPTQNDRYYRGCRTNTIPANTTVSSTYV